MAFVKRDIKDRVVQFPRRYQLIEVEPNIFDLVPVPGNIVEEGTPVNKELIQRYENGLEELYTDKLDKTGDGKDVVVTFTEAATEAHIASGEKLSTLFGKILKKFKNVAPLKHDSSGTTYGVGTTSNYGHVKTINNLTRSSYVNGEALSAYQGKLLKDLIDGKANAIHGTYTGDGSSNRIISTSFTPKMVILITESRRFLFLNPDGILVVNASNPSFQTDRKTVDGGFMVSNTFPSTNDNGTTYKYVAIG